MSASPAAPLCARLDQLLSNASWFDDPDRAPRPHETPPVLIIDDFYDDPAEVRRLALEREFVQYVPPDAAIVGAEIAERNAHRRGRWRATALTTFHGLPAPNPYYGFRFNPGWLRDRLQRLVGETIRAATWDSGGDYWNGAFHLVEGEYRPGEGMIHHHYKPGDLEDRGWSGVVYLSPDAPPSAGTSFWRHRESGRCVAPFNAGYNADPADFELALVAENRFNRAVLFRENVWHRLEHGFGTDADARLTQTLFFETEAPLTSAVG